MEKREQDNKNSSFSACSNNSHALHYYNLSMLYDVLSGFLDIISMLVCVKSKFPAYKKVNLKKKKKSMPQDIHLVLGPSANDKN
jgi:hypothetical protein